MISWKDKVLFDNVFSFGATSAPGVFGRLADLFVHLLKSMSVEEIIKWVDDFAFFRSPCGKRGGRYVYKYDERIFFEIGEDLGWTWELEKYYPFAARFRYIGFDWDAEAKTVSIPEAKKTKYLSKLAPWVEGAKVTVGETENVVGTLNHCALVVRQGRSRLVNLYRLTASFKHAKNNFVKFSVSNKVALDLEWWRQELSRPTVSLSIIEPPPPCTDQIYVDASTSWGIGFTFKGKWLAWKYKDGWFSEGRCIGWGEMVAIELALRTVIASKLANVHFKLRSDNQGVIGALAAGKSYNEQENAILQHILSLFHDHSIWFTIEWVASAENPADDPSRGIFGPKEKLWPHPPKLPRHLKQYIHHSISYKDLVI